MDSTIQIPWNIITITTGVVIVVVVVCFIRNYFNYLTARPSKGDANKKKEQDSAIERIEEKLKSFEWSINKLLYMNNKYYTAKDQIALVNIIYYSSCICNTWNDSYNTGEIKTGQERLENYIREIEYNSILFMSLTDKGHEIIGKLRIHELYHEIENKFGKKENKICCELLEKIRPHELCNEIKNKFGQIKNKTGKQNNTNKDTKPECLNETENAIQKLKELYKELYKTEIPSFQPKDI